MYFKDLQNEVLIRLGDDSSSTRDKAKTWINLTIRDIASRHTFHWKRGTGTITTVANTATYEQASDVEEITVIKRLSPEWKLAYIDHQRLDELDPSPSTSDNATHYTIRTATGNDRNLVVTLYPTPSAVKTYTITYNKRITDLVNPNDFPLVPDKFQEVIIEGAVWRGYIVFDDGRERKQKQFYELGILRMINEGRPHVDSHHVLESAEPVARRRVVSLPDDFPMVR